MFSIIWNSWSLSLGSISAAFRARTCAASADSSLVLAVIILQVLVQDLIVGPQPMALSPRDCLLFSTASNTAPVHSDVATSSKRFRYPVARRDFTFVTSEEEASLADWLQHRCHRACHLHHHDLLLFIFFTLVDFFFVNTSSCFAA